MSKNFTVGTAVKIPVHIQPGAFENECLVVLDTGFGQISGFIRRDHLFGSSESDVFLFGRIINKDQNSLTVQLPGSFFTTATGQANVSEDWACKYMEPATAA